ncbi:hypothetical protein MKW98_010437 [Papaver atlanticum]|uniref:Uncharacterized protein n=1 Tax=Papaver atlanticum TaxID=357466 RepID=A0AAD4TB04_9MAGN|nr:hypothetical protein MKW98_010437 [Papaver atlanticum]
MKSGVMEMLACLSSADELKPDVGDGRYFDLTDCPRSKLRQQCIKYFGPQGREHHEYIINEGTIHHQLTGERTKKKWRFQHSSFLAGGTTLAVGGLVAENGELTMSFSYACSHVITNLSFKENHRRRRHLDTVKRQVITVYRNRRKVNDKQ